MRMLMLCMGSAVVTVALVVSTGPGAIAQEAEHASEAEEGDHGGEQGGGHEELGHGNASSQLMDASEFRADLAIYTFVVFILLLVILSWFAWPPIMRALEARERHIESQIAAAEAKHEEAKKLLAQYEAKLASAAGEVRALLEEARRDAQHTKNQIEAEARKAAEQERQRAVREVELAADAAMKRLAETSANMAIDLAGKVVREKLNPQEQQAIVRDALTKLAASSPSDN